jgi:uncharacterized RDD family membrane protein YckC
MATDERMNAGFILRVIAFILDSIILFLASIVVFAIVLFSPLVLPQLFNLSSLNFGFRLGSGGNLIIADVIMMALVMIPVTYLYSAGFESSRFQGTIGKQAVEIIVSDPEGGRISFARASIRFIGKLLSAVLLGTGFLAIAVTEHKQGLQDKLAGTFVVRSAPSPVSGGLPAEEPGPASERGNRFAWYVIIGCIALIVIGPFIVSLFVFGMAGSVHHTKVVVVTAQKSDAAHIVVNYLGGQDADQLRSLTITVTDSSGNSQTKSIGLPGNSIAPVPGSPVTFNGMFSGRCHVVASGQFNDGTDQVIFDNLL